MKFSDIPASFKLQMVSVAVIMSTLTFLFTTFQTDAEAAQYQQQNTREVQRFRIQSLEKDIREYEEKIQWTKPPTDQKIYMEKKVEELKAQIKLIREGKA